MTLNRNPADYHTEIEQAAFEPSSSVPGTGPSPDKLLMGRWFSYPDAHRHRIGANHQELQVNSAHASTVRSYSKDGAMRHHNPGGSVYEPNSKGGPHADAAVARGWYTDGEMVQPHQMGHPVAFLAVGRASGSASSPTSP